MGRHTFQKKQKYLQSKTRRKHYGGSNTSQKYIFAEISGGLGNQLFIYAAGLVAKHKLKKDLCLVSDKSNNGHSSLDYINILFKSGSECPNAKENMNKSVSIFNHLNAEHTNWSNANIPDIPANTNVKLKKSFYQNYMGIKKVLPEIRAEFLPILKERYPKTVIEPNSAFIHVRRGDYVTHSNTLPVTYYTSALKMLDSNPKIQKIYIISDDISWCKGQNFDSSKIIYFDSKDELETLYLMCLCNNGCAISNSTFSAWGAFLGPDANQESMIIYPSKWGIRVPGSSSALRFPNRWKVIDV